MIESWLIASGAHQAARADLDGPRLTRASGRGDEMARGHIDPRRDAAGAPSRDDRRRLVHALTAMPLRIRGSRGYQYAEVTAGGVSLDEVNAATLESRLCPGLYLVGEILDVDGRLGGFNFQWAWSSGFVAGNAAARKLTRRIS